jgi:hypothetical protein
MERAFELFKTWERASLVGGALGLLWVAFRVVPIVFGYRPLTPQEVGGAVGGAFGLLLVALWIWGMIDVYPILAERESIPFEEENEQTLLTPITLLTFGGLEAGVRRLPASVAYLAAWPIHSARRRTSP